MAELVGIFAVSHGPMIAREWDRLTEDARSQLTKSFDEVGRRIKSVRADVIVIVSPDHWVNFFINNLPSVCIGIGAEHDGPPEPFMKAVFPHRTLPGHAELGSHILETALAGRFDPALSHRLTLDHGFCLPLWRLGLGSEISIVPIVVNSLEAPMPTIERCIEWGGLLRNAIKTFPKSLRVAILATGGLSHSIGEPTMGMIDEAFDRSCIQLFSGSADAALAASLTDQLRTTGNGAHEVRNWVIAHSAAGSQGFELIHYAALPEVYAGCAFAEWRLPA